MLHGGAHSRETVRSWKWNFNYLRLRFRSLINDTRLPFSKHFSPDTRFNFTVIKGDKTISVDTLFFNFSRIQFLWKFRGLTHKRNVQQPEDTGSRAVARNGHELAVNQAIRKKTATWLFFFSFSRTISRASFHSRLNRDTCSGAIYNRNSGWNLNFYKKIFFFLLNFDRTRVSKGFKAYEWISCYNWNTTVGGWKFRFLHRTKMHRLIIFNSLLYLKGNCTLRTFAEIVRVLMNRCISVDNWIVEDVIISGY